MRVDKVICKVTVETPLICGNEQVDNESKTLPDGKVNPRYGWTKLLKPFELLPGKPAIPGSSLRGMLSSLAEASSHSALRVLKNTPLSHRMDHRKESMSAIGLLVEELQTDGSPVLRLQPLTIPSVKIKTATLPYSYTAMFQSRFNQPLLKAYVNGYDHGRTDPKSFLAKRSPASQSADHHEFWYARLKSGPVLKDTSIISLSPQTDSRSGDFLLGQKIEESPISEAEYLDLSAAQKAPYTRGFLRVLGISGRESEMPATKKHEYFIPYPVGSEASIPTFEVEAALKQFHQLADERTSEDDSLPFEVSGSKRNDRPSIKNRKLRLRAGDLVFFRPDEKSRDVVAQVSVSSIWRAANGHIHEYFAQTSPELLPLGPSRTLLTLAEQLFGGVQVQEPKQGDSHRDGASFALASRLRISHATLHSAPVQGAYMESPGLPPNLRNARASGVNILDIPLKNLSSPKPPSPALYFKEKEKVFKMVTKRELQPGQHSPQGRKFYLRRDPSNYRESEQAFTHRDQLNGDERSSIAKQHQSVQNLVRRGTTFF
ncbi:MAG: hypothetical protein WCR20_21465, partial [Verrucomicrobiota bacterium]